MTRVRMTPPLEVSGRFEARTPFDTVVKLGTFYTCIAVRLFKDCDAQGEDVFAEYYEPVGLTALDYQQDEGVGAAIVTLATPDGDIIYVPDTYIASYPQMGAAKYHHVVLAVSLGPLPETVQLDNLVANLSEMVGDVIGVENKVQIAAAPSTGTISDVEHEALETARLARIQTRTTTRAELLRSQTKIANLEERITVYEAILRNNGLMPE